MAKQNEVLNATDDRELLMTRILDAPRALVYKAWTEPEQVAKWWGPAGFTNTITEMDLRPGGVWKVIMHGPDGTDYPNKIVYEEVVHAEKLVYMHSEDSAEDDTKFHVTVHFEDEGKKTKLTMRMRFETAEEKDKIIRESGAMEGHKQTMIRLEELLATIQQAVSA